MTIWLFRFVTFAKYFFSCWQHHVLYFTFALLVNCSSRYSDVAASISYSSGLLSVIQSVCYLLFIFRIISKNIRLKTWKSPLKIGNHIRNNREHGCYIISRGCSWYCIGNLRLQRENALYCQRVIVYSKILVWFLSLSSFKEISKACT